LRKGNAGGFSHLLSQHLDVLGRTRKMLLKFIYRERRKKGGEAMSKRIWWLFPALFLLGSCATTYTHPTKGLSQFEQDRAACERTARKTLVAKGIT
jgi:hypothetical protein